MNNIRCPHCGLVNRLDALTCLRCKLALAQTAASGQGAAAATAVAMGLEEFAVERPLWVAVGLWGLKTRAVALGVCRAQHSCGHGVDYVLELVGRDHLSGGRLVLSGDPMGR